MTGFKWFAFALSVAAAGLSTAPAFSEQGKVYAFGDSLLDDGTIYRTTGSTADAGSGPLYSGRNFSNGATAFGHFGRLTGLKVDPINNHAVSGVFSGANSSTPDDYPGTLAQVERFVAGGGRFSPKDVALIDGGTNETGVIGNPDIRLPDGLSRPVTSQDLAAYVASRLSKAILLMRKAGLRTVAVYNVPGRSAAATAINAALASMAGKLSDRAMQVHVFDLLGLYERVKADPAAFGFVSGDGCSASAACRADPAHLENRYFTVEGLHPTAAGHALIARRLADLHRASGLSKP